MRFVSQIKGSIGSPPFVRAMQVHLSQVGLVALVRQGLVLLLCSVERIGICLGHHDVLSITHTKLSIAKTCLVCTPFFPQISTELSL
jgi:hypothetical protein